MLGSVSDTLTRRKHWGGMQDSRRALSPLGGNRTSTPARSALGAQRQQPQEYQAPQWPDRPQYQEPEQSFDIKRAMTSAIEAQLLPQEFNSILSQMGVVNQQERDQAIGEYAQELELYGDEMKRMEFERTEQAGIAKGKQEMFAKDRQYGLDLAKGAREALGKERKFGLDLGKHELEVSKHGLETRKALTPKEKKWAGSRKASEYERGTRLAVAGKKDKKDKKGFTYQQQVKFNQERAKSIGIAQEGQTYPTPEAERLDKNRLTIAYNTEQLPDYVAPKNVAVQSAPIKGTKDVVYVNAYGTVFVDEKCTKRATKAKKEPEPKPKPVEKKTKPRLSTFPVKETLKKAKKGAIEFLKTPTDKERYGLSQRNW